MLAAATSSSSSSSSQQPMVVVIAGPTATGKSDVAAHICAQRNGIIVSADSVQAYTGVQIGANKPNAAELKQTPHILVNVADHTQNYNAADWRNDAIFAIRHLLNQKPSTNEDNPDDDNDRHSKPSPEETRRREGILATIQQAKATKQNNISSSTADSPPSAITSFLPVVVGGTMMYLQWLVHGRPDAVQPTEDAMEKAKEDMHRLESQQDWEAALQFVSSQGEVFHQQTQKLFGNDWYRLRRILEVAYTVKEKQHNEKVLPEQVYSGLREGGLASLGYDVRCFFLCPDERMKHTKIVDRRCEDMLCKGLLQETADLLLSGELPEMASKAIGYRQTLDYLERESPRDNDEDAFHEFLEQFTAATRRYAKKQMQWFRRDNEFMFVSVPLDEDKTARVEAAAKEMTRLLSLPRNLYDEERLRNTSLSSIVRTKNEEQGKKMKFYMYETHVLKSGSKELNEILRVADACTGRIQAKRSKQSQPL